MLRAEAEMKVAQARARGYAMDLTEELDGLEKSYGGEDGGAYDALFHEKIEIWREMARRIEALERQVKEG